MLEVESQQLRSKSQGRNQRTGDAGGYKKAFAGKVYQPSTKTLKLSTVSQDLSSPPVELKCSECSFIITSHLPFALERQVFNKFNLSFACMFDVHLKQGPVISVILPSDFQKKVTILFLILQVQVAFVQQRQLVLPTSQDICVVRAGPSGWA